MKKMIMGLLVCALALTYPFSADASSGKGKEKQNNKSEQTAVEETEEVSTNEEEQESEQKEEEQENELKEEEQENELKEEEQESELKEEKQQKTELKEQLKQERELLKEEIKQAKQESKEAAKAAREQYKALLKEQVTTLESEGDIEGAFEAQTEAVQSDLKDKSSYKKLGKLYDEVNDHKGMKVFVNGSHPVFDVPPVIRSGRTLLPIRAVSEALKADVSWNQDEQKVTITRDGVKIELILGENTAYINGGAVTLDVPAGLENARTVVPIRFISEALSVYVDWESESGSVIIVDEDEATGEEGNTVETETEGDTEGSTEQPAEGTADTTNTTDSTDTVEQDGEEVLPVL